MNLVRGIDFHRNTEDAMFQEIFSTDAAESLRRSVRLIQIAIACSFDASRDFALAHYAALL